MVCKIVFCFEFPDSFILEKTRREVVATKKKIEKTGKCEAFFFSSKLNNCFTQVKTFN